MHSLRNTTGFDAYASSITEFVCGEVAQFSNNFLRGRGSQTWQNVTDGRGGKIHQKCDVILEWPHTQLVEMWLVCAFICSISESCAMSRRRRRDIQPLGMWRHLANTCASTSTAGSWVLSGSALGHIHFHFVNCKINFCKLNNLYAYVIYCMTCSAVVQLPFTFFTESPDPRPQSDPRQYQRLGAIKHVRKIDSRHFANP